MFETFTCRCGIVPAMDKRLKTVRPRLWVGYAISLLAMVLLAMAPLLQALHAPSCPHHQGSGVRHEYHSDHGPLANPIKHPGSAEANVRSSHGHAPDPCPICQALQTLGKHFTRSGQPAFLVPIAALVTSSLRHHDDLSSFFTSSTRSRAPPLF